MRTLRSAVAALGAGLALTACGAGMPPPPPPPSSAPSPSSAPPVPTFGVLTVTRTGGLAGVHDTWVVRPDGTVTRAGRRGGPVTGTLGPADRAELAGLLADPALWTVRSSDGSRCADGFVWTLSDGTRRATLDDCGDRPAGVPLARAVDLVERAAG